jgi:hypothetical protein
MLAMPATVPLLGDLLINAISSLIEVYVKSHTNIISKDILVVHGHTTIPVTPQFMSTRAPSKLCFQILVSVEKDKGSCEKSPWGGRDLAHDKRTPSICEHIVAIFNTVRWDWIVQPHQSVFKEWSALRHVFVWKFIE